MPKITHEEWIKELGTITNPRSESPGLSAKEIAKHLGCCTETVLARLRIAKELGILKIGKRVVEGVDGRKQPQTVYWIEPRKSGK